MDRCNFRLFNYVVKLSIILALVSFSLQVYSQIKPVVNVNRHTGAGSVSINLALVQYANFKLPVNLYYDASGLKVSTDGSSYKGEFIDDYKVGIFKSSYTGTSNTLVVAANWFLKIGGVVSREIRDLPDDFYGQNSNDIRRGWLYNNVDSIFKTYQYSPVESGHLINYLGNSLIDIDASLKDLSPDIFSFDLGILQGKFILKKDGSTSIVNDNSEYTITYTTHNESKEINSFTIRTLNGVIYRFEPTSSVTYQILMDDYMVGIDSNYFASKYAKFKEEVRYTKEWGLVKITSDEDNIGIAVLYNDAIEDGGMGPMTVYKKNISEYVTKNLYYEKIINTYKTPKKISINGGEYFITCTPDFVDVKLFSYQRKFDFIKANEGKRSFLTEIVERNGCDPFPPLKFEYIPGAPDTDSEERDYWGYYNASGLGKRKQTSYYSPTLYTHIEKSGNERYQLSPPISVFEKYTRKEWYEFSYQDYQYYQIAVENYEAANPSLKYFPVLYGVFSGNNWSSIIGSESSRMEGGVNRNANEHVVAHGTMNRILLQFGGSISIDYESNEIYSTYKARGIRVRTIIVNDGISTANDIITMYEYGDPNYDSFNFPEYTFPVLFTSNNLSKEFFETRTIENINKFSFRTEHDLSVKDNTIYYQSSTEINIGKGKNIYFFRPIGEKAAVKTTGTVNLSIDYSLFPQRLSTVPDSFNGVEGSNSLEKIEYYNEQNQLTESATYHYDFKYPNWPYTVGCSFSHIPVPSLPVAGDRSGFYIHYSFHSGFDIKSRLSKIEKKSFDANAKVIQSDTEFFYESENHNKATKIKSTSSTGLVNKKTIRYLQDFALPTGNVSKEVEALIWLKSQGYNFPLETIQYTGNDDGNDKVTNAELTVYNPVKQPNGSIKYCHPEKQYVLNSSIPVSNYNSASISFQNGSYSLGLDTRLKEASHILDWKYGMPVELIDESNNIISTIVNSPFFKTADINGARLNELSHHLQEFTGNNLQFNDTVQRDKEADFYVFSIWANSVGSGTIVINLSDSLGVNVSRSINFNHSGNEFKYLQCKIPVDNLSSKFNINVNAANAVFKNLLFYPSAASVRFYNYDFAGNLVYEEGGNGKANYYNYDDLGRLLLMKNQDHDITRRVSYPIDVRKPSLNARFTIEGEKVAGEYLSFISYTECEEGTIYHWDFGDGMTSNLRNPQHSYSLAGWYDVTLTVSNPKFSTGIYTYKLLILKAINYSELCSSGPVLFRNRDPRIIEYQECSNRIHGPGENTILFEVEVLGGEYDDEVEYKWEIRYSGGNWLLQPSTTNSCHISVDPVPQNSYFLRATVTIKGDYLSESNPEYKEFERVIVQYLPIDFY